MEKFRQEVIGLLEGVLPSELGAEIASLLETPPDPALGDLALPCFRLSKVMRKSPQQIAGEIRDSLPVSPLLERVVAEGPYLNLYFSPQALARETVSSILELGSAYGHSPQGQGQRVVIDYSAPNIAKPFGIGHLRSTVIGHSLYRIHKALGYDTVGVNHLGDWGTQFGKVITAWKHWGNEEDLRKDPIPYLLQLYVRFHQEEEASPQLGDEARRWFSLLEQGDSEAQSLWQLFRDLSLAEFKRVYQSLGIQFDSYAGESYYNHMLADTIRLIEEKGLAQESQGALIVSLEEEKMPPCLLRKTDGATLYATRDIAAALYRNQTYDFAKLLYVVGAEQSLHLNQVFAVLKKLGCSWASRCQHVPFGLIRFGEGKMSTRQGNIILLTDVLDKAAALARDIIQEKNPTLSNSESVARQIGYGAVIFADLANDRIKEIEFDWEKILDFNGDTGPYVQYAHARICSMLRKAGTVTVADSLETLTDPVETALVRTLAKYPDQVRLAAQTLKPSFVARYLLDLAKDFNRFYHQCPVLSAAGERREARLALADATRQTLANGLYLLGIDSPQEM